MKTLPEFEHRAADRMRAQIPVHLDQGTGLSRDVSADGIYFLTDCVLAPDMDIRFALELTQALPGKSLNILCQGRVLRVDELSGQRGVAASISHIWSAP